MLTQLHIKNFALIDDANINFEMGFSVITGETGAGKSIMLDALGLLTGKRADVASLRNKDQKCVIEGEFDLSAFDLVAFFESNDLEFDAVTIIRREIAKNGKSRAFVNDSPVVLSVLKNLGEQLLDIHSQNANVLLDSEWFYFDLIDGYAEVLPQRLAFQQEFSAYKSKQKELEKKVALRNSLSQELAFKQFQLKELQDADLKQGEQEELEKELELLSHAEEIKSKLSLASEQMSDSEGAVLEKMNNIKAQLLSLAKIGGAFESLSERIDSVSIELDDLCKEIDDLNRKAIVDPMRLEQVNDRLMKLFSLVKKFGVVDADALIEKQNQLEAEVDAVVGGEEEIEILTTELKQLKKELLQQAAGLTKKRKAAAGHLVASVLSDLQAMNMQNSQMEIEFTSGELSQYGTDEINFLFNANKGGKLQNLSKVASGGEFSRIMLSLKRLLSTKKQLPTILFDEIDTGVSGEVADKMALIMQKMAGEMQVISITHLPQIAAKGSTHFKVFKSDEGEQTSSHITCLKQEERIQELAQMLSGSTVTNAAVQNAKELLG